MSDDSDKTEEPSEQKLQDARKKGQVCKSQDATSTLLLGATAAVIGATGAGLFRTLSGFARNWWLQISGIVDNPIGERYLFGDFLYMMATFFQVLIPLFVAAFIFAIAGNMAQIKFLFTTEPLTPKLSKINPIEGFKKIFSMKSVIQLLQQVAKLAVIGFIVYNILKKNIPILSFAVDWDLYTTTSFLKKIVTQIISNTFVGMIVLSILDYIIQRKDYMKNMKMSMQELKDEYKNTEGNPEVKGKIKQMMRQASQGQMMGEVAGASAVVTNPTHLAVAIRYKQGEDQAPVVVAKGENLNAVKIKSLAEDSEVPIVENVELARALFGAAEVGQPIPPDLYKATAELLAYVFKIKRRKNKRQQRNRRR